MVSCKTNISQRLASKPVAATTMTASWRLSASMWLRALRNGDGLLLLLAVALATAIVSGITQFAHKLQQSMTEHSSELLGADLIISSPRPLNPSLDPLLAEYSLTSTDTVAFTTMLSAGDAFQLSSVKAVAERFPLRGELLIADAPFSDGIATDQGPSLGRLWVDARILPSLGLDVGDTVQIGQSTLTIDGIIVSEPSATNNPIGVRAIMHIDDVAATGLIQPGSRITYAKYIAGTAEQVASVRDAIETQRPPEWELVDVREGRPRVAQSMERAERYLSLGSVLAVMLAAVALAITGRQYALHQQTTVAILKTLGASPTTIRQLIWQQLALISIAGITIGLLGGIVLQHGIQWLLNQWLDAAIKPSTGSHYLSYGYGVLTALCCLFAFVYPSLSRLIRTSASQVLRKEQHFEGRPLWLFVSIGLPTIMLLMLLIGRDLQATLALMGGIIVIVFGLAILADALLRLTRLIPATASPAWRLATSSLRRRQWNNVFQVAIYATSLSIFLTLLTVRTTLIDLWMQQIPDDAPNYFLINVSSDSIDSLQQWFYQHDVEAQGLFPTLPGRLTHINQQTVGEALKNSPNTTARLGRDFIFTFTNTLPDSDELLLGQWWQDTDQALVSVEKDMADDLSVSIGDSIRIQIGSDTIDATVSSIRGVNWEAMKPAFYFIFTPSALSRYQNSYMTSMHLSHDQKQLLPTLLREFPTLTLLDIDSIIQQVRGIINKVALSIECMLALIASAGLLVIIASVRASLTDRLYQSAVVRALGASQQVIVTALAIEFIVLGLLAGLLAAFVSQLVVIALQLLVFSAPITLYGWVFLLGMGLAVVIIAGTGLWAARHVIQQPPKALMQALL